MAVELVLIRHATHVQYGRILSGRTVGVPLGDDGRGEAERLAARLAGGGVTRVDCSPLERTAETARIVAAAAGVPVREVADLIEIDMGDWTGRDFDTFGDDPAWRAWNERRGSARIPGGETMAEAQARIVRHIDRLIREDDGATIALVSHADMIRAAAAHVLGLPLDRLLHFDIDPASVTRVVAGDWGARLLSLNERLH